MRLKGGKGWGILGPPGVPSKCQELPTISQALPAAVSCFTSLVPLSTIFNLNIFYISECKKLIMIMIIPLRTTRNIGGPSLSPSINIR